MAEQPTECCCCGFPTEDLKDYGYLSDDPKWCCELCAGTLTSRAHSHPEQFRGQEHVMKTICYVGNTILAAIKKSSDPTTATTTEKP